MSKNLTFSHRYFLGKLSQKRLFFFLYILYRKECFQDKKTEVLKKSVKSKFSKGVSPYFFNFGQIKPEKKIVFWYCGEKRMLFRPEKRYFWKAQKIEPCFVSKKRIFFHAYFLDKPTQKRSFFDILDRKECV